MADPVVHEFRIVLQPNVKIKNSSTSSVYSRLYGTLIRNLQEIRKKCEKKSGKPNNLSTLSRKILQKYDFKTLFRENSKIWKIFWSQGKNKSKILNHDKVQDKLRWNIKGKKSIYRFNQNKPSEIYSDSQKHESSCLLSDCFWCISPEPFELQKIFKPLIASLFKELSDI